TELGYNVAALQDAGLDVSVLWNNIVPAGWGDWSLDPKGSDIGEDGQWFQYNPAEAAKLLDAVGYDGAAIQYHYANDIYGATFNRIAEGAAGYVNEGGVNAEIRTQAYTSEYFPQTFAGNFDGMAFGYQTPFPEVGGYFNRMFGDDPNNHSRISDAEITPLIGEQAVEIDPDARREIIWEIQRINARNMYYIPNQAGAGTGWTGYQPELRGISQTRGYGTASENLPNFWLDV
ncbi:MAG: ABC transporter substrate-binding protein, partial [Dehalococcoidia bacterium]